MNIVRNLIQQLKDVWNQSGAVQRAALSTAALLLTAAVIGVGIWSARPQYVTVASELTPRETAELTGRLDAKNIRYKVSFSGSAIQVRKSSYKDARMAAGDLVSGGGGAPAPIGASILDDPSLNGHRMERRLEESLARTIVQFDSVESATVHIGKPAASPFAMSQEEVTASVVIRMRSNVAFGSRQAAAIVATVAQGVEGLVPANVTVSDTQGRILSNHSPGGSAHIAGQLEYRQRVESDLAANAQLVLSQLVGIGNSVVRVTADIDFNSRTSRATTYDPDAKVRKQEIISSSETRGRPAVAGGIPGAAQIGGAAGTTDDSVTSKEDIDTIYQNAQTIEDRIEAAGAINRLTVAAVVDLSKVSEADNAAQITPEKLEGIIKQAVGFDVNREDEIELLIAPLAATEEIPLTVASPWRHYEALLRSVSLGMAALVALVLGTLTLRKVQIAAPRASSSGESATLDTRRTRALASMSDAVRRNPNQLRDALSLWLEEAPQTETGPSADRPATKAA